jgi:G3E family GTPase
MESTSERPALPVTVLTGFLGSGKTTVLARLLQNEQFRNTAVIINEFGEVGLDHDLLQQSREELVLLSNGCICCTVRGDLLGAFAKMEKQRMAGTIDRIIIETTGLADPAPILHTLMSEPSVTAHYWLDQVIATVDAVNGMATLDRHPEAVKQAAIADRILLTKLDLVDAETGAQLRTRLTALNPAAPMLESLNGALDPQALLGAQAGGQVARLAQLDEWLREDAYGAPAHQDGRDDHGHDGHHHDHGQDRNRHDDHIRAYSVIREQPVSWAGVSAWLEMLGRLRGDDLLRVKGIINVIEHPLRPVVIHGVQHLFHPPVFLDQWPSDDHRTRLVFITRDIDHDDIDSTLEVFENRRVRSST